MVSDIRSDRLTASVTCALEVGLAGGRKVGEVCRSIGVSEQTYYRWRTEYGGLKLDQAKRLKELRRENSRL